MKEKLKKLYYSEKPLKIEWAIVIIIGVLMLCCFKYVDLKSLTVWSTNIWDVIFIKGDITQYYNYTADNVNNIHHQYVSGVLYSLVLWGIWNLPIWAIQTLTNIPINQSTIMLIWSHMFLYAALIFTLIIAYKVVKILTNDKNKALWASFLSASFAYTAVAIGYSGQNDIINCMFGVSAIYCLIKNKKIPFYILAGFAISVKFYFLIPYIAIILVTEKDIFKICLKFLVGLIPVITYKLICGTWIFYRESEALNYNTAGLFQSLFSNSIGSVMGFGISLFLILLVAIYIMAYLTNNKNEKERNENIIYYATSSLLVMFMTVGPDFYRMILLMPFLMILFVNNQKIFKINIILELVMTISSLIINAMANPYFFAVKKSIEKTILYKFFEIKNIEFKIGDIFEKLHKSQENNNLSTTIVSKTGEILQVSNIDVFSMLGKICTGLYVISIIAIIILNHPKFKRDELAEFNEKCPRWLIWVRTLLIVPIILIFIYEAII